MRAIRNILQQSTLSLTARLTIGYTLSSITLIIIATLYLYWSLVQAVTYRDRKFFTSTEDAIRSLLDRNDNGVALRYRVENEWPARTAETFYVRLWDDTVVAESPNSATIFKNIHFPDPDGPSTLNDIGGRVFRSFSSAIEHKGRRLIFQIALDRTDEERLLSGYRYRLFGVLVICLIGSALVCFHIARRGLRPIRNMAETATRITSANLDEKIPTQQMPLEVAHLASTFNQMLDRLKGSFERLQRFSADIAHELRTPINNISGELQVALGKERAGEYYQEAMGSCLEECGRLCRIIDSLLFIARTENPELTLSKEVVNVRKELESAIEFFEPAAAENGISCTLEMEEDVTLVAERTLFQRAVGNILANAVNKTNPAGWIRIGACSREGSVHIDVRNSGEGIAREHLPFVFDRFYRVDTSRSKDAGGSGLGLAIVKSIASIHGGSVKISSEPNVETCVRLSFPKMTIS